MCFTVKQTSTALQLAHRFKAEFPHSANRHTSEIVNGFTYPLLPVITQHHAHEIQLFHWGLLPSWAKERDFRKNTLNARIETLAEKPSFKNSIQNRCLILIDGFYEYQWLDEKGKTKQKYMMTMPDDTPFALAGLWNTWTDKNTGEILQTCTILTTEANPQMAVIHNSKKRMPIALDPTNEIDWLNGEKNISTSDLEFKIDKMN